MWLGCRSCTNSDCGNSAPIRVVRVQSSHSQTGRSADVRENPAAVQLGNGDAILPDDAILLVAGGRRPGQSEGGGSYCMAAEALRRTRGS